jgi:hypothetical protein
MSNALPRTLQVLDSRPQIGYSGPMHVIQVLLVHVPQLTSAAAAAAVQEALPGQDWYDYYDIGGRWDGHLGQWAPDLADPNVMALDHPAALSVLADLARTQDQTLAEAQAQIRGAHVGVSDLSGNIFGLPVEPTPAAAAAATARNQQMAQTWEQILTAASLSEARQASAGPAGLTTYMVRRLLDLVDGVWTSRSGFYYPEHYSTDPADALALRQSRQSAPGATGQDAEQDAEQGTELIPALVAVDFHS